MRHKRSGWKRSVTSFILSLSIFGTAVPLSGCSPKNKESSESSGSASSSVIVSTPESEVAPVPKNKDVTLSEAVVPEGENQWQYDASFPNWQDRSGYSSNNRLAFFGYPDQGKLYLTTDVDGKDFHLYINDTLVDTSSLSAGKSYAVDFSGISKSGSNTLQISGLSSGAGSVRVRIPYPTLLSGSISEVGLAPESIDLIERILRSDVEHGFPSAQVAIVKDGKLVYEQCFGNVRSFDDKQNPITDAPAVTKDSLYDLASVTKMFSVNYALQYLVSQGKVDIDTKVVDILGSKFSEDTKSIQYAKGASVSLDTMKSWKSSITIRDLLLHQAGFPAGISYFNDRFTVSKLDIGDPGSNVLYVGTGADAKARLDTFEKICQSPLQNQPRTQTLYSDMDYMILCFCIEKITGMRLDDFLRETFWEPLGLTHITYNPMENGFGKEDCVGTELAMKDSTPTPYTGCRRYAIQGEVHDPLAYYCMDGVSGHAGLFSNASDLAVLASIMLTGGYGEHRFFSQDTLDLFTSLSDIDAPGFALGWWREGDHARDYYFGATSDSKMFGHQGFTGPVVMIDPETQMVIVILSNKIHTPTYASGAFCGNVYSIAWPGFIPEILHIGMDSEKTDPNVYLDLVTDMRKVAEGVLQEKGISDPSHPRYKAYESLLAVEEELKQ